MPISKKFDLEKKIESSWHNFLKEEFRKEYFSELQKKLKTEYKENIIYPSYDLILRAFSLCPVSEIKVVILGQDPYHRKNQADGLCFSVSGNTKIPPSLKNIFKEIKVETNNEIPDNGNLDRWAKQGILMLNSIFTVREGEPGSHNNFGWEIFSEAIIKKLSKSFKHLVFILWGAYAGKKSQFIDSSKHFILKSSHPSPFSARISFFGNNHFIKTNEYLKTFNKDIIIW